MNATVISGEPGLGAGRMALRGVGDRLAAGGAAAELRPAALDPLSAQSFSVQVDSDAA